MKVFPFFLLLWNKINNSFISLDQHILALHYLTWRKIKIVPINFKCCERKKMLIGFLLYVYDEPVCMYKQPAAATSSLNLECF